MKKIFYIGFLFLCGFTPYDKEIANVTTSGYRLPANITYVYGERFQYDISTRVLTYSDKSYSPEEWSIVMSKRNYVASSAVTPNDPYNNATFRHELGHAVDTRKGRLSDTQEWIDILSGIDIGRDITEYAKVSRKEAFAEAFALYTSPEYGKKVKRLPPTVEQFFESIKTNSTAYTQYLTKSFQLR